LESGERDLTEEEKREAFAELETASPLPPSASQNGRKRKAAKSEQRRGSKADKVPRLDTQVKPRGVLKSWSSSALPFMYKYRKREAQRRATDREKSDDLTKTALKQHITIVFDSPDFKLQKNKLASPTDNTLKVLMLTFKKLADKEMTIEEIGIQALVFDVEGVSPHAWDVSHSVQLDAMVEQKLLSNDGIMYLRLTHHPTSTPQ
jgi:hypothetical protein